MISKRFSIILVAVMVVTGLFGSNVFAANEGNTADIAGSEDFEDLNIEVDDEDTDVKAELVRSELPNQDSCAFNYPDTQTYGAEIIAIRRQLRVNPGENFRVKVFLKNTGNAPWFSNESECHGLKMSLGTDKERDHKSVFYQEGLDGWESPSRIGMDQLRIDPRQIASFTFMAKAGNKPDMYKEYFTPFIKDVQWLDSAQLYLDVMIGDTGDNAGDLRQKVSFAAESGSVTDLDLNAERKIKVDLSDQTLSLYLGGNEVRKFRVSTGKASTPTPKGKYEVMLKQEVRIGNKPPHYVMPNFMMFRKEGYGFHALPSLARNGGDAFWTEARNHIGIPVSHGCVRLLPEDASWVFDFSNIGTKVEIEA